MSYQVKIELEFEYEPFEEDVIGYIQACIADGSLGYEIVYPYEDPFDDPSVASKDTIISKYYHRKSTAD